MLFKLILVSVVGTQARQKMISGLPQNLRTPLLGLHKATQGVNVEEFLTETESALSACDVVLRKVDKKKDKAAASQQRHVLIDQLNAATDSALVLHVAALLLFHTVTQTVLIASGRFVPQIIAFLQSHLPESTYELLSTFQSKLYQHIVVLIILNLNFCYTRWTICLSRRRILFFTAFLFYYPRRKKANFLPKRKVVYPSILILHSPPH